MAMIHLVMARVFSPLFIFILLASHPLLNQHHSCSALRFDDAERRELDHLTLTDTDALRSNEVHMGHDQRAAAIQQHSERSKTVETDEQWPTDSAKSHLGHLQFGEAVSDSEQRQQRNDALFLMIVGTCSVFGILGLVAAAIFWYKIQRRAEEALDSEYPSYGVSGPSNSGGKIAPNSAVSDRKLAQSAQMFHYQQQRQQMMAQEKAHLDAKPTHSDDSDDEAPNGGDYTVYECPGLAPTGEMEVRNPLFAEPEPSSSVSHPSTNNHYPQPSSTLPSSSSSTQEKLSS